MALKFVNKNKTKLKNFLREFSITNTLSSSPFIIKVFDVVFETEDCYVFAQEYAPGGDLFDIIPPQVGAPAPPREPFRGGGAHSAQGAEHSYLCAAAAVREGARAWGMGVPVLVHPDHKQLQASLGPITHSLGDVGPITHLWGRSGTHNLSLERSGTHCTSLGWPETRHPSPVTHPLEVPRPITTTYGSP